MRATIGCNLNSIQQQQQNMSATVVTGQRQHVVKCCHCSFYQVDIVKKSTNKWSCKMCGGKQTLMHVFFEGDARECRDKVKLLNGLNGERGERLADKCLERVELSSRCDETAATDELERSTNATRPNKWAKYLSAREYAECYGQRDANVNANANANEDDDFEYDNQYDEIY